MAEQAQQPEKRWVILTFFEHPVERTEEQIAELKAGGLWVRDASGPEDHHDAPKPDGPGPAPAPEAPPRPAAQPAAPKPAA